MITLFVEASARSEEGFGAGELVNSWRSLLATSVRWNSGLLATPLRQSAVQGVATVRRQELDVVIQVSRCYPLPR